MSNAGSEMQKSKALVEVETQCDRLAEECKKLKTYDGVLLEMQQEQEKAAEELSELQQTIETLRSAQEQETGEWERMASELRAGMEAMQEHKELEIL